MTQQRLDGGCCSLPGPVSESVRPHPLKGSHLESGGSVGGRTRLQGETQILLSTNSPCAPQAPSSPGEVRAELEGSAEAHTLFFSFLGWHLRHMGVSRLGVKLELRPQPQSHQIMATSATYTTARGNTRSSSHWVRPGIEPESSWIPVGFLTC